MDGPDRGNAMETTKKKKRSVLKKTIVAVPVILILGLAIYCMANGLGLVDGLDFGAGAYYYADIPQFARYVDGEHFVSQFPMWFHIALFLVWGFLMFKLWVWVDKKDQ